jgi:hypothetical protein
MMSGARSFQISGMGMPDGNGWALGTVSYIALAFDRKAPGASCPRASRPDAGAAVRLRSVRSEMHATTNRFRAMLRKTSGFQDEQC